MQATRGGFVHLLYAIILLQFGVIAVLVGGLSSEYLSNVYFRMWINSAYPWVGLLLGGQLDALLAGVAAGATLLLVEIFRNEVKLDHVVPVPIEQGRTLNQHVNPQSVNPMTDN
ncbi:MAG TPA: hypothetical protein VFV92_14365 [Candidatus Bathyarchaeia archaeon]|nr:hypothetical protein [Candidatus Bathyarchaeia archaeon]